jgi:hypothetical protein
MAVTRYWHRDPISPASCPACTNTTQIQHKLHLTSNCNNLGMVVVVVVVVVVIIIIIISFLYFASEF